MKLGTTLIRSFNNYGHVHTVSISWHQKAPYIDPHLNARLYARLSSARKLRTSLRPILNFAPRGEFCPLGVKFFVCPSILLNIRECSTLGVNEGANISPGAKFTPRGNLRMALRFTKSTPGWQVRGVLERGQEGRGRLRGHGHRRLLRGRLERREEDGAG
jgi:hypothetical protein